MPFRIWRTALAVLLCWPVVQLAAQTESPAPRGPMFTLPQLVATVLAHNPALQMAQRSREQADAGIATAGAWPNPRLEWQDGRSRAQSASGTSGAVTGWGVSQFIENPSLRSARVDAAEHGLRSSEAVLGQTRNEVAAQVRLRAYEYLLRIEQTQAASEELLLLEQTRDRVRVRVNSGEAARYEIIKAEAEFISARQRHQAARLASEQARIRINQLAAGQLPKDWLLVAQLDDPLPDLNPEELRAALPDGNLELRGLRADYERQQARVREAGAGRWPGVELRYTDVRDPDNRQGVLGASIQIPLLDQRRGPRAEAQAEALRVQARLEGRQAELLLQLDSAWAALEMASSRVEALDSGAVRDAEAALRVAEAAYRFGERGILDVLDAQRVLRAVRADLLQARFQLQAAAIEIDLLIGREASLP